MKRLQILGFILVLSLTSCSSAVQGERKESLYITTSFYPIYLLAKELTTGVEGIDLSNMAQPQSGCLHDYTLSTGDMRMLSESDVLLLNGGGMEGFLEDAIETFPELMVVDTSLGIPLLSGTHDHGGEEEQDGLEVHEGNGHFWLSLKLCQQQIMNMVEALGALVPKEKHVIQDNGARLIKEIEGLIEGIPLESAKEINVAIFHEGFDYFAQDFGLNPVVEIFVEEYETPTPQELAEAVETGKAEGIRFFLAADDGGLPYARMLAEECGGNLLIFDPMTTGDLETGRYLDIMKENVEKLRDIYVKEMEE